MENTNILETADNKQEIIKIDLRKKHLEEGYTNYATFIKDSKYNNAYYHKTKIEVVCDICKKKLSTSRSLKQHQKSMKCRLIKIDSKPMVF